jgi:hypothetical protein
MGLGYVPEATVSVLVAREEGLPSWVVGASPAIALAVALLGQRAVKGRGDLLSRRARAVVLAAFALEGVAVLLLGLVVHGPDLPSALMIGLVVAATAVAELALIGVIYVLWDVQYSVGPDTDRGAIVGVFTIGTSAGMALSPAIAAALYFRGAPVGALTLAALLLGSAAALAVSLRGRRRVPVQ